MELSSNIYDKILSFVLGIIIILIVITLFEPQKTIIVNKFSEVINQ